MPNGDTNITFTDTSGAVVALYFDRGWERMAVEGIAGFVILSVEMGLFCVYNHCIC
jgi:hypothetical protein